MFLYAIPIAFLLGLGLAWWDGHARLSDFRAAVEATGHAQEERTKARIVADNLLKEEAEHDRATELSSLAGTIKRLRDERSRSSLLPAATASTVRPDRACFDRTELDRTLQRYEEGITGLLAEGDERAVTLNVARRWAQGLRVTP